MESAVFSACMLAGTGNYTWANGRVLPLSSDKWNVPEPQETETGMRLKLKAAGKVYFMGFPHDTGKFLPLCQSGESLLIVFYTVLSSRLTALACDST